MTVADERRIVQVANYLPPSAGGIEKVSFALSERLADAGWRATLVGCDPSGAGPRLVDDVHFVPVPAFNTLERFGLPIPIPRPAVRRVLGEVISRADVVHLHSVLVPHVMLAARYAARRGIPIVLTEHTGIIANVGLLTNVAQRLLWTTGARATARTLDAGVVLNERVRRDLRQIVREPIPIVMIPNGVDTTTYRPATPAERARLRAAWGLTRPTVLVPARNTAKKQIGLVIDALGGREELEVVVCGKDTERLNGAAPNVRALGVVDPGSLAELYRAADLLALFSSGEGFPLVLQEALASGLPVVVGDDETNRGYLDANVAVLVEPTLEALRAAVPALLADEPRRHRMAERGRELATSKWSWKTTVDAYEALYHDVCMRSAASRKAS